MVRGTMAGVVDGSTGEARMAKFLRSKVTFSRAHEVEKPRVGDRPRQHGAAGCWCPHQAAQ